LYIRGEGDRGEVPSTELEDTAILPFLLFDLLKTEIKTK